MENDQNVQSQEPEVNQSSFPQEPSGVSFPTVGSPQKSGGTKTLLIVGILILVAILGFVIYKSATGRGQVASGEPTPFDNLAAQNGQGSSLSPSPSATPKAADRSKVGIQVQNGTGITGEAAYLQTQLNDLGYTNVKVGNASDQSSTSTQVTFASSLDSGVVAELTQKLKALYQNVTVSNSGTTTFDVVVVTGLRKGATAKPSASPTPTASASASPAATGQ